jgi:hypothetical protein
MKKGILLLVIFCWGIGLFIIIPAQDIPQLDPDEIQNAKITSQKTYEGEGLYGYIDGGAELYMEYGFDKLMRQELELNGEKFTLLIYRMADPQSAFGIYSLYRYKCDSATRLTRTECNSTYAYMAKRNRFYYSVINQTGSKSARMESIDFAKTLAGKIHPDSIPWPDLFNMDVFIGYQNALKYIRGNIALQQVLVDWSPYFETIRNYSAWYLPVENEKSGTLFLALIRFNNTADRKMFIKNTSLRLQKTGDFNLKKSKMGWNIGDFEILYLDATASNEALIPYASAIYQFLEKLNRKK